MRDAVSKAGLSPSSQRLIELMTRVQFGTIESLMVSDGEPCFDPPPRVTRELRMKSSKPSVHPPRNFELKDQIVELILHLREIDNGIVQRIEVQNGLPFRLVIEGGLDV